MRDKDEEHIWHQHMGERSHGEQHVQRRTGGGHGLHQQLRHHRREAMGLHPHTRHMDPLEDLKSRIDMHHAGGHVEVGQREEAEEEEVA